MTITLQTNFYNFPSMPHRDRIFLTTIPTHFPTTILYHNFSTSHSHLPFHLLPSLSHPLTRWVRQSTLKVVSVEMHVCRYIINRRIIFCLSLVIRNLYLERWQEFFLTLHLNAWAVWSLRYSFDITFIITFPS